MAAPFLNGPTLLWANAAAKTMYFRQKGNIQSGPVAGVMSCYAGDIENYDETTYRDEFVGDNGAGDPSPGQQILIAAAVTDILTEVLDPSGTPSLEKVTAGTATTGNALFTYTDPAAHIAPRPEKKVRTMFLFYDAATNAGSVVHWVWADELISFSLAEFEFI